MQISSKARRRIKYAAIAAVILTAMILRMLNKKYTPAGEENYYYSFLRSFLYIGLFMAWGISLWWRIMQRQVRRFLIELDVLMIFWMTVRTFKFSLAYSPGMIRYLWYSYYIPLVLIPLLVLFAALSTGRPDEWHLPKRTFILIIASAILILLVLTNDLHQLAFTFEGPRTTWTDDHYGYGPVYYMIVVWAAALSIFSFITIIVRCRRFRSKKLLFIPFGACVIFIVYSCAIATQAPVLMELFGGYDMAAGMCLLIIAMLEGCILAGLIRTNTDYEELFAGCSLDARIIDKSGRIVYAARDGSDMSDDMIQQLLLKQIVSQGDRLFKSNSVCGGFMLWSEDVSEINDAISELEEVRENLRERVAIEQENYEVNAKLAGVREKSRLYDSLRDMVGSQLISLQERINKAPENGSGAVDKHLLGEIAVLAAYVKRAGNLMFIGERDHQVIGKELALCFTETFDNLRLLGVECAMDVAEDITLEPQAALSIYSLVEKVIEAGFSKMTALWVSLAKEETEVILRMMAEGGMDRSVMESLEAEAVPEENAWSFTVRVEGGSAI